MGFADLPKSDSEWGFVPRALDWAMEEFFLRNGVRVQLASDVMGSGYLVMRTYSGYDGVAEREIRGLADAALAYERNPHPPIYGNPGRGVFTNVPLAQVERIGNDLSLVPWWRRLFTAKPTYSAEVTINIIQEIPQVRQINEQLRGMGGLGFRQIFSNPVTNGLDLTHLFSQSYPVTQQQQQRYRAAKIYSGGGAGDGVGPVMNQLISTAWDVAHQTQFSDQQNLAIAIAQRNHLVTVGGSTQMIAAWNAEIKQLLWDIRRGPV